MINSNKVAHHESANKRLWPKQSNEPHNANRIELFSTPFKIVFLVELKQIKHFNLWIRVLNYMD